MAAAPGARAAEPRPAPASRLPLRLTGGLMLPLRLARGGDAAPGVVRQGRLLAGRLLRAVVKLANSVDAVCTAGIRSTACDVGRVMWKWLVCRVSRESQPQK